MKLCVKVVGAFVLFCVLHCSPEKTSEKEQVSHTNIKYNLKNDLASYVGSYSAVESTGGTLSSKNLPVDILAARSAPLQSITIEYLQKIKSGYLLTFNVAYTTSKTFVVSTLDSTYSLIDYRIFTNGAGAKEENMDTIAVASYHYDRITIETMRPNRNEEPVFSLNGIKRDEFVIDERLRLVTPSSL